MINRRRFIPLVFILLFCISDLFGQENTPKEILFVGNSYTYFWNLPQTLKAFCDDKEIEVRQSTAGGASLGHHWRGDRGLESVEKVRSGSYNAVILQDHSMMAIDHPDSLMYFGKLFGDLIKEKGAQTYLYMTWSREWDPFMQEKIELEYNKVAEKINAKLVPVGLAWERARELRPGFPLYDEDRSHPSSLGTYLTACVFYAALTGESPIGLPNRLTSKDADGETIYLTIQSRENAIFCQKVALEIVRQIPD